MKTVTFYFEKNNGWSTQAFPDLDSLNTLILVFASSDFDKHLEPIQEISARYPQSQMLGCSSAGEIYGNSLMDESIVFTVIQFKHTKIKTCIARLQNAEDSYDAGREIISVLSGPQLRGVFVLSDGLNVNGSKLSEGLNSLNLDNLAITGGLAGDGDRFQNTWTVLNGVVSKNSVVAVGFYGDAIRIGHGSYGGWQAFGVERRITKASQNTLYELDHKPALSLYREYLGEKAEGLPATGMFFPLGIRKNANEKKQLVRTLLSVNQEQQSITFAGDLPTGHLAQLMRTNSDSLIDGAHLAGVTASHVQKVDDPNEQTVAIAISCIGRRLVLGKRTDEELDALQSALPFGSIQVGFYSYGELSPDDEGVCDLHNQTMTITTLSEQES